MAFTLDDRSPLDVAAGTSPRWQRFAGGRRLTHVGYRWRVIRFAFGTTGAALLGAAILFGDGRTTAETWSFARATAHRVTQDVVVATDSLVRSVGSEWNSLVSWARLDAQPRRLSTDTHAVAVTPTRFPQPTATPETASSTNTAAAVAGLSSSQTSVQSGSNPSGAAQSAFGAAPSATPALTLGTLAGGDVQPSTPPPSPTSSVRQPAGTPIPVVTSTPVAIVATSTGRAPTPISATATIPRPAPTAPAAPKTVSHQVVPGDTLWGIATRYGSSVDAIMRANRLIDADSIVPGARLVIPR